MRSTIHLVGVYDQRTVDKHMEDYTRSAQSSIDQLAKELGYIDPTLLKPSYFLKKQCLRTHLLISQKEYGDSQVSYLLDEDVCPSQFTKSFRAHNKKALKQMVKDWNNGYNIGSIELTKKGAVETYTAAISQDDRARAA